eukprot:jgi/Phyca11/13222/fgenesh1_pg.PHYCAscaffold_3_\
MTSVASSSAGSSSLAASSSLSALTPAFSMVPSAVRRHNARSDGPPDGDTKRRSRPRHRKKKEAAAASDRKEEKIAPPSPDLEEKPKPKRRKRPAKKNSSAQKNEATSTSTPEEDEDLEICLLCADPIKFYAVGECNHHGICSKCSMRMRLIMDDRNCPMCKQPLERVVVSSSPRPYESFELWGDAAGPESVLDELSEMIFVDCKAHYSELRSLREFKCRMRRCREVKHSLGQLKEHLRHEHGVDFCELCLTHQSFFIQEQEVFTKGALKGHNIGRSRGDQKHANTGKDFHPMCQFCRKRFYGDKELYEHLERDHFKCHICKVENEYFRNYASMETHFRREHHLCEDRRCLEMRFVVFPNDVEYQAHMTSVHGVHNRLQFNFQVARGGGNPEPSCHSVSLRVMSGEERALMHQLASFYGVISESFGEDPHRRISFFKREDAHVPTVTLSAHISNLNKQLREVQALRKLKFLPLQGSTPPAQAAPVPARPPVPVNRGWERIEPRRTPVVADAWSDDDEEEETEEDGTADSADSNEHSEEVEEKISPEPLPATEGVQNSQNSAALEAKIAEIKLHVDEDEEWE